MSKRLRDAQPFAFPHPWPLAPGPWPCS